MVLTLIAWPGKCLLGFSIVELLSSPFCTLLFGRKSLSPAHTQGKGMELSKLHFLEWEVAT